jgi:hypothetical protein
MRLARGQLPFARQRDWAYAIIKKYNAQNVVAKPTDQIGTEDFTADGVHYRPTFVTSSAKVRWGTYGRKGRAAHNLEMAHASQ